MTEIPTLDHKGLRKFGLTTGLIVVVLFAFFFPWLFEFNMPTWPWMLAGLLWAPALLVPRILQPVYIAWMKVGHAIGWVNTRIILAILFYLFVLPMGLVMRMFGKDPMARKIDDSVTSYRIKSVRELKNRLEKPF